MPKPKSTPLSPEAQFVLRWFASNGVEVSPEQFQRLEGKFICDELPPDDREAGLTLQKTALKNFAEWRKMMAQAFRIQRQRLGNGYGYGYGDEAGNA